MKCLILAAGQGSRLQQKGEVKPLIPLLGIPLIERVIRSAHHAGADDFFVVTGYQSEKLKPFITQLGKRLNIPITCIHNEEWEQENGLSVLKARDFLQEPFLLLMADHVFDPEWVRILLRHPLKEGEVVLCVDQDIHNPLIDMEDVTRVKMESDRIQAIGKGLADYNAFDTGIFLCTPGIFPALEESARKHNDTTLSGAGRVLAAAGRFHAVPVTGRFWMDVDSPAAFKKAAQGLLGQLRNKATDGPVSRYLNRPMSIRISGMLVHTTITPNQISFVSFLLSLLAAGFFAYGGYLFLVTGGLLAQFASVIDGCDGEVARLKFQQSDYGGWFDAVLDRYADAFLLFGLTWHAYEAQPEGFILLTGFMAIIGSFMLSYTADKYDHLMHQKIGTGSLFRMGRDVRVFLILLGALFNQALLTLVVIAVVMNGETLRRVIICRDNG